ncbi:MAG: LuxR C-terminal-related transcriptional regulator [Bacteroidales bacterium]
MEYKPLTFKGFFEKYAKQIRDIEPLKKSYSQFENYPLLPSQAIYVMDMQEMSIPYHRRIDRLLGYLNQEFVFELFNELYHPEDYDRYMHLLRISNEWARRVKPEPFSIEVTIDCRMRKKDGTYLKILRQSTVFETCRDKSIKSVFTILSDISKIKTNNSVNLSIIESGTGRILLEDSDKGEKSVKLTRRETEIISLVKNGLNSSTIADELKISRHTVDTFRRKMLKKTGCKNTVELLSFCAQQGII